MSVVAIRLRTVNELDSCVQQWNTECETRHYVGRSQQPQSVFSAHIQLYPSCGTRTVSNSSGMGSGPGSQADLLGRVALVLQRTRPDSFPLDLALRIDAFVDPISLWTLETATTAGHTKLLSRLAAREWPGVGQDFRKRRYGNGLKIAVETGHLDALKWWAWSYLKDPPILKAGMVYAAAAEYGHVHILQWLKDQQLYAHAPYSVARVRSDHSSVVRWLHGQQSVKTCPMLAAITGDLDYIRWLHSQPAQAPSLIVQWHHVAKEAASHGQFGIVQWMFAHRRSDCEHDVLVSAIEGGHLAIAQWVYDQSPLNDLAGAFGLACTDLEMLNWVMTTFDWSGSNLRLDFLDCSLVAAAGRGELDVLEMYAIDQDWDEYYAHGAMIEAAKVGHLHVVQWLHMQKGVYLTDVYMTAAMENGQLDVAEWLFERYSGGWREQTTNTAIRHGQLKALQWLHTRGIARYGQHAMRLAAQHGHLEIVRWIRSHVDRTVWWSADPFFLAVNGGHLDIAQWMFENDRDVGISLASSSHGAQVMKLTSRDTATLFDPFSAISFGHFALVEWLLRCTIT